LSPWLLSLEPKPSFTGGRQLQAGWAVLLITWSKTVMPIMWLRADI
jgi:hypothetical protein